ncbi:MAG: AAA family ATPase, partial [Candidatus Omnitrophica bacterium]|nr:AAA family ATPase [Candidatus Omnitrophota bacterium]
MYNQFYNLIENPFNITADPDFFFESPQHREAINHLLYGVTQRKGILLVTGEIGTGKTTLCRTLLGRLPKDTKSALVLNPNFSDLELLKMIVRDLGVEGDFPTKYELITALNQYLIKMTNEGYNVVIIIDEAQNLGVKELEEVRLLSNLETEKHKLLQIILVGQPELIEKLQLNELRQINQRIAVRYHLLPMSKTEIKEYIRYRIKRASNEIQRYALHFTNEAIDAIYENSQGTPRMVN